MRVYFFQHFKKFKLFIIKLLFNRKMRIFKFRNNILFYFLKIIIR